MTAVQGRAYPYNRTITNMGRARLCRVRPCGVNLTATAPAFPEAFRSPGGLRAWKKPPATTHFPGVGPTTCEGTRNGVPRRALRAETVPGSLTDRCFPSRVARPAHTWTPTSHVRWKALCYATDS
jgi:hypothetical protein